MEFDRKNIWKLLGIIAFGVTLFVGLWHLDIVFGALGTLLGMINFFIVGLCIAFILNAPMRLIENRLFAPLNMRLGRVWGKLRRPLALVLTVLLVLGIIALVIFMVIPEFGRTISMLTAEIPAFFTNVEVWIADISKQYGHSISQIELPEIDWDGAIRAAIDWLQSGAGNLASGTFNAATSFVSGTFSFVLGIIVAMYVLISKEKLSAQSRRLLYAYLPAPKADRTVQVSAMASKTFSNFISGQFTECFILGVLCFLGMSIFGFPFAGMVSVLVGVTAIIPIFGAFIGLVVGAFMILVHQGFLRMAWFIVFFLVLQQIEGNLIYPHVVGKSVMLPGLWVLVAATLGGNVAGILGMLISVPLASVCYALLREAASRRNAKKGTAPEKLAAR